MYGIIRQNGMVYFTAAVLSLILSYLAGVHETVINPDAICYLQSAESLPQGLSFVTQLCGQAKWPFYSIFIFSLASATKFSYLTSAYILDALFTLISVVSFIAIIQSLKNNIRTLCFAAFVILFAHQFNTVREYIVRDHGFWAFYLLSIVCLMRYFRFPQWSYALAWSMSLVIATLFRIEGVVFLVLLPLVTFLETKKSFLSRIQSFLQLNTVFFLGLICVCVWMFFRGTEHLGRLNEIQFQILHGFTVITEHFQIRANLLAQHILSQYSAHDASLIFIIVLISWFVIQIVENLSLIYAVLVIYAWWNKLLKTFDPMTRFILWGYIIVNIFITFVFLVEHMFLTKRYLLPLSLILMIWIPLALDDLYHQWQKRKWPLVFALFCIIISGYSSMMDRGYPKKYIHDAGNWLNLNLPEKAKLYSNDYQLMYYSQRFGNDIFKKAPEFLKENAISNGKWKQFDFLALRFDKKKITKDNMLINELGQPIQVFANKRGDQVIIYKVN